MENVQDPIELSQTIDFENLNGCTASLYYNNHLYQFQLGSVIFEVVEDEDDGYRSSMREVKIIKLNAPRNPGDFISTVSIVSHNDGSFQGYKLQCTTTGHEYLTFGTDNYDDYYPCFVFNFTPLGT